MCGDLPVIKDNNKGKFSQKCSVKVLSQPAQGR